MATAIILTDEWEMKSSGVVKPAGTRIVFSDRSEEMQEIINQGKGEFEVAIPPDLPGREHFLKAGFNSLQDMKALKSWEQVKGIGPKTAEELDEYFKPETEAEA